MVHIVIFNMDNNIEIIIFVVGTMLATIIAIRDMIKNMNKRIDEQNQLLKEIINTLRDIQEGKK